ncbi:galactose-binding domain-containing protein [Tenacibaculum amylolyticum]|uniref:galactose-binding domain-containing protein n=1 Tax=Tenacibaculum amylolyticum TaxID=104269 RepID=UPI0038937296
MLYFKKILCVSLLTLSLVSCNDELDNTFSQEPKQIKESNLYKRPLSIEELVSLAGSQLSALFNDSGQISKGRPVRLSSVFEKYEPNSLTNLIVGPLEHLSRESTIAHTNADDNAWAEIDLEGLATVEQVIIYNRYDCCKDRLGNYNLIYASQRLDVSKSIANIESQPGYQNRFYTNYNSSSTDDGGFINQYDGLINRLTKTVQNVRYVYVRQDALNTPLNLTEVIVKGSYE